MKPYALCKIFVNAKTYSKEVITTRVNTFFAFGQLSEDEYSELMVLVTEKYPEVA